MYHVTGTAVTVSILYFISYIFYKAGLYSLSSHRRLWNSILAATFIFTALAGLFLALQINYRWEIPGIKSVLKWHVETGAGMAITGVFHLFWHFSYFRQIFSKTETPSGQIEFRGMGRPDVSINLFIIGFVSMSVQILLMREIMNISGGYELTTGIYLGSWLIASGMGAFAAGKSEMNDIRRINLLFATSPVVSLVMLVLLSRLFLETGETPSFLATMGLTFLVLVPFCVISGFSFIKLIAAAKTLNGYVPGRSFSTETAGGIVAGVSLSLLTAGLLGTYQLLLTIILMSLGYVILSYFIIRKKIKILVKIIIAVASTAVILSGPDLFFRQLLLPGINVTGTQDTPYGNITYGEYSGERSLYYNHRLLAYADDAAEREENVHYGLLQRANPEKVLIISGSLNSLLPEILKYPVKTILYIERDPELASAVSAEAVPADVKLMVGKRDAFRYLKTSEEKFDAVLLLLPPPSTLSLNRYYTAEFFRCVMKNLAADGVFVCSPGIWDTYPNMESLRFFSSIYNSLDEVFESVKPIAGNKLYFIASGSEVTVSVCSLTKERKISNVYVGPDFLADDLIEARSSQIISLLDPEAKKNTSQFPVAAFHFQTYNFSRDINEKLPALIFLIIVFTLPVITIRRKNLLMYCSASALAGFEIIILLILQLTAGNMYQFTGIILAVLMAGLAAGAGTDIRFLNSLSLTAKALSMAVYLAVIALITNFILSLNSVPAIILLLISALLPSFITGHIFRGLTIADNNGSESAATYSADLAGSAFGFMVISGVAIPLIGLKASILLLSGLIFAGILLGTERNKY